MKNNINIEKTIVYGVSLGFMISVLYLLLNITTALTYQNVEHKPIHYSESKSVWAEDGYHETTIETRNGEEVIVNTYIPAL